MSSASFSSAPGSHCCRTCWRYSASILWVHSRCPDFWHWRPPCSQDTESSGSFFTRLGIGGVPFLLPLLYQVGLGFTPIESGLLVMPQAIAAMSMKTIMPRLLRRVGYRGVLISNTLILGILLLVFATIGLRTPVWVILLQAFIYGAFTSLQYTSMSTLVYADIEKEDSSSASSIA